MPDAVIPGRNPAPGYARKPDHIVSLKPAGQRVTVRLGGEVIAETDRAVLCEETGHDPVYYIPMTDPRAALLRPSSTRSHCPFTGDASYWSVSAGGKDARDAAWAHAPPRTGRGLGKGVSIRVDLG